MCVFKGGTSRLTHLEKFILHFSRSSFTICVNLFHPEPSLFLMAYYCLLGVFLS